MRIVRVIGRSLLGTAAVGFAVVTYAWITLPDVRPLRTTAPPQTAFMAMRAAEARREGQPVRQQQRWVGYDHIAPVLRRAVLVSEDAAFFQHDGLDYDEIRASVKDWLTKGEPLRGASTVTQQLAKNLYLSPSRNPVRKLKELFITRRLEAVLGKRRILEVYLNVVEWGNGIWGCEAAARAYFGASAADLDPEHAALLAASLSGPRIFDPAHPTARLRWKQEWILRRLGM